MKDLNLVDKIAKDYYQRFGCNCSREEALQSISCEQNVSQAEVNEAIMQIQALSSSCCEQLEAYFQRLISEERVDLPDPDLDCVFSQLPFPLSEDSKNEIIKYANWCVSTRMMQ
jgi:hypothetical protein